MSVSSTKQGGDGRLSLPLMNVSGMCVSLFHQAQSGSLQIEYEKVRTVLSLKILFCLYTKPK